MGSPLIFSTEAVTVSDGNRITTTVIILQLIIQLVICPQAIVNDGICIRTEEHLAPNIEVSQVALVVKNLPANEGHIRDTGSIPGLGRSPGGGHGNPLQYSCLENPMDRGKLQSIESQSRTRLKQLSTHTEEGKKS